MKPITLTAFLALILAIPFVFKNRRTSGRLSPLKHPSRDEVRYDIDDFLT
jgi:hypothetical protein